MGFIQDKIEETAKSIIKYTVVPGVAIGTYFIVRKDKKLSVGAKFGIVAGSGVLAFLVQNTITNILAKQNKADVNTENLPVIGYDASGAVIQWNADPLSQEISNNLEGYNFMTYGETAKKILNLNNDQIKELYNHYNAYYATDQPTLTKLFQSEWRDWEGNYDKVETRLKSLGLNEGAPLSTRRTKKRIKCNSVCYFH